jgi:hypothetical protein
MPGPARRAGCLVRAVRRGASAPAPVCHRDPDTARVPSWWHSAVSCYGHGVQVNPRGGGAARARDRAPRSHSMALPEQGEAG